MVTTVNETLVSVNDTQLHVDTQHLSDGVYLMMGVYLTILGVLSFLGNLLVLLVLTLGRPNFLPIHTALLISSSSADMVVACISFPMSAISSYHRRWVFGDASCVISAFIVYFLVMVNINALCVMAVCRYIIVCQPRLEKYIRGRYIKYSVLFVWLLPLFWAGTPLIGWSRYVLESFGTTCTLDFVGTSTSARSYNVLCCVFCYILPVSVFIFCYFNVTKTTRRNMVVPVRRPFRAASMTSSDRVMEEINRKLRIRTSRRMSVICFTMIVSFTVTWTPYALISLITIITTTPLPPEVHVLPTMIAKFSCALNPIIYCGLCAHFRDAAARMFALINQRWSCLLTSQRRTGPISYPMGDISVFNLKDIQARCGHRSSISCDLNVNNVSDVDDVVVEDGDDNTGIDVQKHTTIPPCEDGFNVNGNKNKGLQFIKLTNVSIPSRSVPFENDNLCRIVK